MISTLFYKQGSILVSVIVFAAIAITMTIGLVNWGAALLQSVRIVAAREQALQIAEAGIDYYRWHLAHVPQDFYDGTGGTTTSPYTHPFYDKDGNLLGSYALTITPPPVGSTIVTIISKGTLASSTISRSLKVVMAIPSLAQYAVIANDVMNFGIGTVTRGPIQSNNGIHFDGTAFGPVSSALLKYNDPDNGSCTGADSWAVHTCVDPDDPIWPNMLPAHADVFKVGRQVSVPAVDFGSLSANLNTLYQQAISSGGLYLTGSGVQGYRVVLKNNNTLDLYRVNSTVSSPNSSCTNGGSGGQWGLWTISAQQFIGNYAFPTNGVLFIEDNVWIEGLINGSVNAGGAHITVVAAKIGETNQNNFKNITINNNLLYTNKDGTDTIGLIAQGNVNVGYGSPDIMEIDAALVAQNGRVGRYYYNSNCGTSYRRTTLTLYGMIATNLRYGFAWGSSASISSGYQNRNITYDAILLYAPPPSFPLTSSFYSTLSWQEI